jgi:hypothetical protein
MPIFTASVTAAIVLVEEFRTGTLCAWHPSVAQRREEFADRLVTLIQDPTVLDQGPFGFCGGAAFARIWAEDDPEAFVQFALTLYEQGISGIGDLAVVVDDPAAEGNQLEADFELVLAAASAANKRRPQLAEWLVLGALQNAFNDRWGDWDGSLEDDDVGVYARTLVPWLRAAGYRVRSKTRLQGVRPAATLSPTASRVLMLVDAYALGQGHERSGYANHFVVLLDKVRQVGDQVQFTVWTWGQVLDVTTDVETFEDSFYGALVATKN